MTASYHQTMRGLAQECCNAVAWDISQTVLDRHREKGFPSDPPAELSAVNTQERKALPSASSTESIHPLTSQACQGCGFHLHPGWRGTSIRVRRPPKASSLSANRTLRRREQRKRRRAARAEDMNVKETSRGRRTPVSTTDGSNPTDEKQFAILYDSRSICRLDRNLLVLTCGRCHEKTYLKGLRREIRDPSGTHSKPAPQSSVAAKARADASGTGSLGENFEPLPKHRRKPPPRESLHASESSAPLSLLEQKLARKKKKKPTSISSNEKSGNLLLFLSSLNNN